MLRYYQAILLLVFMAVLPCGCGKPPPPPPPAPVAQPEEIPVLVQNEPPVLNEEWVRQPVPVFVDTADDIHKVSHEEVEMNGPATD